MKPNRSHDILAAIVREYIVRGEAVGSRTLVRRQGIEQSAATVRNVMSDLEEQGLLRQPHTSAGRIPTASGLRLFVDRLMKARELSDRQKQEIVQRFNISHGQLQALMRDVSRLLSELSQQCAVVLVPRSGASVLKRIEFVPISPTKLIAVLVMSSGLVQNRLLSVREPIPPAELAQMHNYLNELCVGRELSEVRRLVGDELEREQNQYDRMVARALEFGAKALTQPAEDELVIEGRARLLDHPEMDREQLKELMQEIEHKRDVLRLLDETMLADGVKVFIGAESTDTLEETSTIDNFSVIAAAYGGDTPLGTLGVIGPSNMDYPRLVPLVDFTAGILTEMLR